MPSQQTTNAIKIAGSIGVLAASEIFMPGSSAIAKGATVVAGLDVGGFCKDVLKSVFGNFTHQFMNNIDAQRLFDRFGSGEKELNHDIEKLMLSCLPTSIEFLKNRYLALNPYKNQFVEDTLNRLVADANIDTDTIKDYDLMASDKDAWLNQIHDYIFRGQTDHEGELVEIETFFKANLAATFQLHFIEGLKDPSDEKPLKAFLIKTLHGLNEQAQKIAETQEQILTEIKNLKDNLPNKTVAPSRSYFEKEFVRVNKKLDELLSVAKETQEGVKFSIDQNKETHQKLEDLKNIIVPKKTTTYLTQTPSLGTFIGREDDLKRLTETLEKANQVVLVNGLGGIGKTTLAKAYVHAKHQDFAHIAWINVLTKDTQAAFVNTQYNHPALTQAQLTQGDTTVRFAEIMRVFSQITGDKNLLVIDNAETDIDDLHDALPSTLRWKILLTSRDNLDGYQTLPLDELSPEDALRLFKEYYTGKADEQELMTLLQTIHYHTLTVELLAKTLEKSNDDFDLKELNTQLKNRKLDDEKLQKNIKTEHWNAKQTQLFTHLLATFELSHKSDYEIWVLKQFAALPPEPQAIKQLREWLQIDETHKKAFDNAIEDLHTEGWLRKTRNEAKETCYAIHRLIQDMVHYQHPIVYEDIDVLVDTFKKLLYFDTSTNFPTKFQYLAPAEQVLNNLPEGFENNEIRLLMNNLGETFRNFADLKKAKYYLEKVVTFSEIAFGEEHSHTTTYYSNLALVLKDLGDYEGAKKLLEKATISDENNFGEKHPTTAVSYSNLALVLKNLGDYEGAKKLLEKATISFESNFGEKHPNTAVHYSNLAMVLKDLGDYEGAKKLLEKALMSNESNFGLEHPNTALSYSNLAVVLKNLGDYEEAKKLLEKALISDESNFGLEHPNTAMRQYNLATVLINLQQLEEGYTLFTQAYNTFVLRLGIEHPYTQNCLSWLNHVKGLLGLG